MHIHSINLSLSTGSVIPRLVIAIHTRRFHIFFKTFTYGMVFHITVNRIIFGNGDERSLTPPFLHSNILNNRIHVIFCILESIGLPVLFALFLAAVVTGILLCDTNIIGKSPAGQSNLVGQCWIDRPRLAGRIHTLFHLLAPPLKFIFDVIIGWIRCWLIYLTYRYHSNQVIVCQMHVTHPFDILLPTFICI